MCLTLGFSKVDTGIWAPLVSTRSELQPLFLGIDGGGTSCRARLCDHHGEIIGSGDAGSANTTRGLDAAFLEIMSATKIAISNAGLTDTCLKRIHAGLGLAGLSLQRDFIAANSYAHPFATLCAETDAYIACLGAHQGKDGAILIIGTGTCGLLIKDGNITNVGGWGFALSDFGSGALLGRAALRQALKEFDHICPASSLGTELMGHFQNSPEAMVAWSETATPKDFGRFAPDVLNHANKGDVAALELVQATAREIERLISTLISKGAEKVALVGGLSEPITPWLADTAHQHLTEAKGVPLDGAVMLARRGLAGDVSYE